VIEHIAIEKGRTAMSGLFGVIQAISGEVDFRR